MLNGFRFCLLLGFFFTGNAGLMSSIAPLNVSNLLFSRVALSRSSADFVIPVMPENVSNFDPSVLPKVSNLCAPRSGGEFARSLAMSRLKRLPIVSSRSPKMLSVLKRRTFRLDEFERVWPSRFRLNILSFGLTLGLTEGAEDVIDWTSGLGLGMGSISCTTDNVGTTGCSFSSCWTLLCEKFNKKKFHQAKE